MSLARALKQRLDILRASVVSPATMDDWNQPGENADAIAATLDGAILPLSIREVALLTDAGAQIGDFRGFLDGYHVAGDGTQAATDVLSSDRVRDVTSGAIFEVRSVLPMGLPDSAGQPGHYELMLRRVID